MSDDKAEYDYEESHGVYQVYDKADRQDVIAVCYDTGHADLLLKALNRDEEKEEEEDEDRRHNMDGCIDRLFKK